MPWEIDTAQIDAMGRDFATAASLVPEAMADAASGGAGQARYSIRGEVVAATPRGKTAEYGDPRYPWHPKHLPGALERSTVTATSVFNAISSVDTLFETTQEEIAEPNLDGSGGGYDVTEYILHGRGPISAPSSGPHSTGKRGLLTSRGVRRSVGEARPAASPSGMRPYIEAATPGIMTASTAFLYRWGEATFNRVGVLLGMTEAA